jgi:hypothetical protein
MDLSRILALWDEFHLSDQAMGMSPDDSIFRIHPAIRHAGC